MKQKSIWLLVLFILIPMSSWAEENVGPRMVIVNPVFDAGKVNQGATLKNDFIVKNIGDEELRITKVDPG